MAGKQNFTFEQGVPFERRLVWKTVEGAPIDLTGYSAALQIRTKPDADALLLELTSGSGITLGGVSGTIDITASEGQVSALESALTSSHSPYAAYKLMVTPASGVKRYILEGRITIDPWG